MARFIIAGADAEQVFLAVFAAASGLATATRFASAARIAAGATATTGSQQPSQLPSQLRHCATAVRRQPAEFTVGLIGSDEVRQDHRSACITGIGQLSPVLDACSASDDSPQHAWQRGQQSLRWRRFTLKRDVDRVPQGIGRRIQLAARWTLLACGGR